MGDWIYPRNRNDGRLKYLSEINWWNVGWLNKPPIYWYYYMKSTLENDKEIILFIIIWVNDCRRTIWLYTTMSSN